MAASVQDERVEAVGVSRVLRVVVALGVGALVVAADQATKSLAIAHVGTKAVHLWGPFGFEVGYNSGSAFSLFTGQTAFLAVIAAGAVGVLAVLAWCTTRWSVIVALGLVLGGALSNLSDRLVRGHRGAVVDFITLTHWPTFNVADSCVTVGVILLVILVLFRPASAPRA
jgi:signal peptidase II